MDSLHFSSNWNNKLSARFYTTIRLHSYKYQVDKKLLVHFKKKYLHTATIRAITLTTLDKLNSYIIGLDMGYSVNDGKLILLKMYPHIDFTTQKLALVLLEVDPTTEQHPEKITDMERENATTNYDTQLTFENTPPPEKEKEFNHTLTENQVMKRMNNDKLVKIYTLRKTHG
jgi:hypothetical protein